MMSQGKADKLCLLLWAGYPLLVPFYVIGRSQVAGARPAGGLPQPADFYLVGLMLYSIANLRLYLLKRSLPIVAILACFLGYVALVNLAWSTILEDLSLQRHTLFYIYDGALLFTCLLLHAHFRQDFLRVTVYAVLASTVLQALLSPFSPHESFYRQEVFFNDANQLGYFVLLAAVIVQSGLTYVAVPRPALLLFYLAAAHLALISQSRGALAGLGVLAVVAVLDKPLRLLLVGGALLAVYVVLTAAPDLVGKSSERFVVGGSYDTLSTRGYDRMVNYPEYMVLGAGEGAYERFRSDLFATELHSSYGTLLFCYGIVGAALFTALLLAMCRCDWRLALWLIPIFVYGSGHHGLRFAFCWAALGFLCCVGLQTCLAIKEPGREAQTATDGAATLQPAPG
jgi:hypothetical protein